MQILFYINPSIVRGDPSFYLGAIEKKLIPQAKLLHGEGHQISFVCNEFNAGRLRSLMPLASVYGISHRDLLVALGSANNVERRLYKGADPEIATRMNELLATKVPGLDSVDLVVAWETPANHLRDACPNARIVHQMPGFLSRVPFPELFTLDVGGLFNESVLASHIDEIRSTPVDPRATALLQNIRARLLTFIAGNAPFSRADLDPERRYKKLVLLPLQVTEQYAFLTDSGYESQMGLLLDVLDSVPSDVGVVVTQYASASSSEKVLSAERYFQLKQSYPNLVYDGRFDVIDNISQYLLAVVDAVVTVSSSIGAQALLWNKPLIALAQSHLLGLATHGSVSEYINEVNRGHHVAVDADAVLGWMLTYQQPLAGLVTDDKNFLCRWISSLPEDHKNFKQLPNFFDLAENYEWEFERRLKIDRASELLHASFGVRRNTQLEESFKKKISEVSPKTISFDIFDTLIDRAVEQPVHVFKQIEADVDIATDGRITNFAVVRQATERQLREKVLHAGKSQEITLDEIYDELAARYELSQEQRSAVCRLEVQEELRVLSRREAGWRLFETARKTGAKILLISDMYLPETVIREVLRNAGYPEGLPLYLSSTLGLRKHEGDLFSHVADVEALDKSRWLHVGDNPHGDVSVPAKLGIHTFRIQSAYQLIAGNKKLAELLKSDRKSRSNAEAAIYGLIQRRYFDDPFRRFPADTHFGGDPFALGYIGMAPVFYGFLQWLMTQAKRDGIEKLLFLSRDGKVLWRMAQVLFPESEGWPGIAYAMSSRRAARVAALYTRGDLSKLVDSSISPVPLAQLLKKKFGIDLYDADQDLLEKCGFADKLTVVSASNREGLRDLVMALEKRILQNAEEERKLLVEHYRSLGVVEHARVAVVDIGYAATMQAAIQRITRVEIAGYYYVTFESAREVEHRTGFIRGYAGDFVKREMHHDPICQNGFLFETLFCSSDASFVRFVRSETGGAVATFDLEPNDEVRCRVVEKVHNAAVALAHDLRDRFGNRISRMPLSSAAACRLLADFIASPSGRDAEIFEGCVFDDGFAGAKARFVVPPRKMIASNPGSIAGAIWKEGAAVFGRRPDVAGKRPAAPGRKAKPDDLVSAPTGMASKAVTSRPLSGKATAKGDTNFIGNANSGVKSRLGAMEKKIIASVVNDRKQAKYFRDRSAFFQDSKGRATRAYWRLIGSKLNGNPLEW